MTIEFLVREASADLVSKHCTSKSRILILGATGWFGRTALALLQMAGMRDFHLVASSAQSVETPLGSLKVYPWSYTEIIRFEPDIVLNFAFLTKEKWARASHQSYMEINRELTRRYLLCLSLPSISNAITVSSGSAQTDPHHPYGYLKREEEILALQHECRGARQTVLRAWSVSGPFVQRPEDYLFSNLINQALHGSVEVKSNAPVWRRYVGVDDFLAVGLAWRTESIKTIIDSGGLLIEAGELARQIAELFGVASKREDMDPEVSSNVYVSDGKSWDVAHRSLKFSPADLAEQITLTARGLNSKSRPFY